MSHDPSEQYHSCESDTESVGSIPGSRAFSAVIKELTLTDAQLRRLRDTFREELQLGLAGRYKHKETSLQCAVTFVSHLFTGSEEGHFLGLDLGGTNFRVICIRIEAGGRITDSPRVFPYRLTEDLLTGPSRAVFEFIADKLEEVVTGDLSAVLHPQTALNLGFTFSFPMRQTALNHGVLLTWTKSFRCTDGVGEDAYALLQQAISKRESLSRIRLVAILNDTTGTLVSASFHDPNCGIGVILGTGTNAGYWEQVSNIADPPGSLQGDRVIVEVDWGAFGDNGCLDFLKLAEDFEVDRISNHPGSYTFEKLISGMYLGEIVNQVLKGCVSSWFCDIQQCSGCSEAGNAWKISSQLVLDVANPDCGTKSEDAAANVVELLSVCGIGNNPRNRAMVSGLCSAVVARAATILGVVLAQLVLRVHTPTGQLPSIAFDGSLYRENPFFQQLIREKVQANLPEGCPPITLLDAVDGSGLGAALLAATVPPE